MTTEQGQSNLLALQQDRHPGCVVCGACNEQGLRLRFQAREDGSVEAFFRCHPSFQGYAGILHGGVIASLLDGAMTNCLFMHGQAALTAELTIRFLKPVPMDREVRVRAWLDKSTPPLFRVAADVRQDGELMARGSAKFMASP